MSPPSDPPAWRELLGREYLGAAIVLAGGVLVGAINIYLAASLLPTAVADLGGASFSAWNMTVYLVAMVIATMLTGRLLSRWGNVGAYVLGFATFTAGSRRHHDRGGGQGGLRRSRGRLPLCRARL
ncbi:hypothetical protein SAMN05421811_112108 [Nonomuraea wenchangensis]|uniref:Major Facilitator Superfamily protein n=1 Tax=Nonomuraea wenchangensis TaxID=568860 RepID=A0A1I0L5S1_9ACTN|nr:hypothetical protein SAMN05421811_112108 [Nonomuraea wenchangensis]